MRRSRELKFRTEIRIIDAPRNLTAERQILLIGSCFSDNIGAKMIESGWKAVINPCGTVYNPLSIANLFRAAPSKDREKIIKNSLTKREGRMVSWLFGKKGMGENISECVSKVNMALDVLKDGLENSQAVIVTFGTSDVWFLQDTGKVVGNCHKHPAREFGRRRMGLQEIIELWRNVIVELREINPAIKVIFTVSPRRYLADGFQENTRQKAVLILACEELCKNNEGVFYFPAYEIMNDDLRDYRFYASDMLHPSELAVEYIWSKFKEAYCIPDKSI